MVNQDGKLYYRTQELGLGDASNGGIDTGGRQTLWYDTNADGLLEMSFVTTYTGHWYQLAGQTLHGGHGGRLQLQPRPVRRGNGLHRRRQPGAALRLHRRQLRPAGVGRLHAAVHRRERPASGRSRRHRHRHRRLRQQPARRHAAARGRAAPLPGGRLQQAGQKPVRRRGADGQPGPFLLIHDHGQASRPSRLERHLSELHQRGHRRGRTQSRRRGLVRPRPGRSVRGRVSAPGARTSRSPSSTSATRPTTRIIRTRGAPGPSRSSGATAF